MKRKPGRVRTAYHSTPATGTNMGGATPENHNKTPIYFWGQAETVREASRFGIIRYARPILSLKH